MKVEKVNAASNIHQNVHHNALLDVLSHSYSFDKLQARRFQDRFLAWTNRLELKDDVFSWSLHGSFTTWCRKHHYHWRKPDVRKVWDDVTSSINLHLCQKCKDIVTRIYSRKKTEWRKYLIMEEVMNWGMDERDIIKRINRPLAFNLNP